jgi:DNA-binding NarL/FixJ family response regulator
MTADNSLSYASASKLLTEPRILLADDHSMIRKGLKLYLQSNLECKSIGEVSSCTELMKELIREKYTHLILDIILNDGSTLEVIPNITKVYPKLKILVFSMQPAEVYGEAIKQYGLKQYLSKSLGEEEIYERLKQFILGEQIPDMEFKSRNSPENPFASLAPRELEILHYLLRGMRTKEIAETINLKMNTISTIKTRIYFKTNAENLKQLLELASLYNLNY